MSDLGRRTAHHIHNETLAGANGDDGPPIIAGHAVTTHADAVVNRKLAAYLHRHVPHVRSLHPCGGAIRIHVHCHDRLFTDCLQQLAAAALSSAEAIHGAPYRRTDLIRATWWQPAQAPHDHLYALDARGQVHIVLHPRAPHGERHMLRVIRETVLRCGVARRRTALDASAAAVRGHGVLIVGGTMAGASAVLLALAAHARAELIASDQVMVTDATSTVIGVPGPVRVPEALRAYAPRSLPAHRLERDPFGKHVSGSTRGRIRDSARLRLVVLPCLDDGDAPLRIAKPDPAQVHQALTTSSLPVEEEPWLRPSCAPRVPGADWLRRQTAARTREVASAIPAITLSGGIGAPRLLPDIADVINTSLRNCHA